ncbi:MAG: methyltransferase domain-containing protein [Sedimenticolaceae bacterium]
MGTEDPREKWDRRYADALETPPPIAVLTENSHLLPERGRALDLACGLGGSALYLARRGLQVSAWDLSPVAVAALAASAGGLDLAAEARDVTTHPPSADRFDVICVGHFLERALCPHISDALRPGGLLFYQTFTRERVDDDGPSTARFRLETNELLRLFPGLILRFYRDEGRVGDTARGFRNYAQMIAQRPC